MEYNKKQVPGFLGWVLSSRFFMEYNKKQVPGFLGWVHAL